MRRVLQWGVVVVVVVVLLGIAGFVGLFTAAHELDPESKAYADASVNAIVAGWNPDALLSRGAPEITAVPPDQIVSTFAQLRKSLANARNNGCEGHAAISWGLGRPISTTAGYKCPIDVTGGRAVVTIFVRKTNGAWKVTGFWVNPKPVAEEQ